MYDFYYNKLQQIFSNIKLLFTDTDSLCISIMGCEDVYTQIREGSIIGADGKITRAIDEFDLSGYASDHPLFNGMSPEEIKKQNIVNRKVPGKMKDELDGNTLLEFVGLREQNHMHFNNSYSMKTRTRIGMRVRY